RFSRRRGGRAGRPLRGAHPGLGREPVLPGRHQGGQAVIEGLDPTAEVTAPGIAYVDRPAALGGKRGGPSGNTNFNSDRLLERIGAILKAEYGVAETRMFRKHNASVPAHEEIIVELRKGFDAMVAGVGD